MLLDCDDRTLQNVYYRPNLNAGTKKEYVYWPVPRIDLDNPVVKSHGGPMEMWYSTKGKAMKVMGCSDEEIQAACMQYLHPGGTGSGYTGPNEQLVEG